MMKLSGLRDRRDRSSLQESARADGAARPAAAESSCSAHRESTQRLLLQRTGGGEITQQVTEAIEWSSSHPGVATVADGVVRPVGDGEAIITAKVGEQAASAKVVVTGMDRPFDWSFRNHVEPVLRQARLQLRRLPRGPGRQGRIPALAPRLRPGDRLLQHRQARSRPARRARRSRPQPRPGEAVRRHPPQGGRAVRDRLAGIPDPRRLDRRRAPPPAGDADPRVDALEVLPGGSVHRVGETQQIVVRARYSDGRAEDVTRWVKCHSADESVCRVDEDGVAAVVGPGEGAVVAWYASKIAIARITVPYAMEAGRR